MRTIFYILISISLFLGASYAETGTNRPLDYAQNFSITEYDSYTLLTVRNPYRNATREFNYALVSKDAPLPESIPSDAKILRTPVDNVALMETVYVGFLDALDRLDSIGAAASTEYISHPEVIARVAAGEIPKLQYGQKLNIERLLLLQPELIFTTSLGEGSFELSPQLERAGLNVVLTADYMERHPLARAEWIKFIAAFYEADAEAEAFFEAIKESYSGLLEMTQALEAKPTVFCGAPYSGVWHVPGGDSFFARFIEDAGGDYLWSDDPSQGGLPLDTERVYLKAAEADYWVNPGRYRSLAELYGADTRFDKFEAAQSQRVYNNSRQTSPNGGNNIWERGIVHPEEVLADLIKIFHPDLLPNHAFIYFEQLQ